MSPEQFTAFVGTQRVASGALGEVAAAAAAHKSSSATLLVLNDRTGRPVDLDLRGDVGSIHARYAEPPAEKPSARGRPRLGVTPREVTLLPAHWEWLAQQPGGASAALRRLVEQARRSGAAERRQALEAVHHAMTALAGDFAGYEDALRALYANDDQRLAEQWEAWPEDVAGYLAQLLRVARQEERVAGRI